MDGPEFMGTPGNIRGLPPMGGPGNMGGTGNMERPRSVGGAGNMGGHEKMSDYMGGGRMGAMAVKPSAVSLTSLLSEMAPCFIAK